MSKASDHSKAGTEPADSHPFEPRAQVLTRVLLEDDGNRLHSLKDLSRVQSLPELLRRHGLLQTRLFLTRKGETKLWNLLESGIQEVTKEQGLSLQGLANLSTEQRLLLDSLAVEVAVLISELVAALNEEAT